MNITVLTSSRADYGIYSPLLRKLERDPFFDLSLIVFGTHVSSFHGATISQIRQDGYKIDYIVESLVLGDSPEAISSSMGLTTSKFAGVWAQKQATYDLVICLGDRYEMFAAVSAAIPFNFPIAHIHGGEKTLGAIDNQFRNALTHMAQIHFTTTETYKKRVKQLVGEEKKAQVYNVGALSLDNLEDMPLYDKNEFLDKYQIDLSKPTILFTFHPETVNHKKNVDFLEQITSALEQASQYQVVITMPNSDTYGDYVRTKLVNFAEQEGDRIICVESLGTRGYFSCMHHCSFVMGNSSSGIIEAASLGKYVLNLGNRQKGRIAGENVRHIPIDKSQIVSAIAGLEREEGPENYNPYWNGGAANKIIEVLKKYNIQDD